MWAALTAGVEGAPVDDYPEDLDLDSTEEADLAKKREWHFQWLEAVISYYGTNEKDGVYETIRRTVEWNTDAHMQTKNKVAAWALSCSRAQNAVASEAWDEAESKTLFMACAKVLPEAIKTLLQQNKPEGGQHTWKTAAKFLNQRTRACEADDAFRNAVGFVGPESGRTHRGGTGFVFIFFPLDQVSQTPFGDFRSIRAGHRRSHGAHRRETHAVGTPRSVVSNAPGASVLPCI